MASVVSTRVDRIQAMLKRHPALLLTEEQAGAYLLGLIPPHQGPLSRDERGQCRAKASQHLQQFVSSGELVRLGFGVPYLHTQASSCHRATIRNFDSTSAPGLIEFSAALLGYIDSQIYGYTSVYSGRDGVMKENPKGSFRDPVFQRTWAYADPKTTFEIVPELRYSSVDDGEFVTPFFASRKLHEKDWVAFVDRVGPDSDEGKLLKLYWSADCAALAEFGQAGDAAIRLLRIAELNYIVAAGLDHWYPAFSTQHGVPSRAIMLSLIPQKSCMFQTFTPDPTVRNLVTHYVHTFRGIADIATVESMVIHEHNESP